MAEPRKGTCTRCPRTDVSINADETLRLHAANGKRVNEDNPRCPGSGQPPAGAQGLPETVTGYVCRVPAGPDGCGRPVQLTANSRARSHLNSAGHPCGGGSDWPLRVNERGERTDMAPQGEVYPAVGPDGLLIDGRASMVLEFDPQDPDGPGEAPTDPVQERLAGRPVTAPGSAFITELKGAVGGPGTVASQLGTYAEGLFDATHDFSDPETQTYGVHPGEAADCRLPGCCTHPRGFDYGDDGKGQSGSFCFLCGAPEPEPCVHEYGGHDVWDDQNGTEAQVSACLHCGEIEPEPTPEELKARSTCIVGQLDTGVMFTRASFPGLVFRVEAVTEFAIQATVVSAGSHHGRTGELTNLTEEITCTDKDGAPRPRRTLSAQAPTTQPTTVRPTAPRSTPPLTPTATPSPAGRTAGSGKATSSAPTAKAAGSTRSAPVIDAFSTPKQATKESDKYDSYGRYKLLHPKTSKKVNWTRATTFAKSIQDTYALSMWSQRTVLKGAALRSDLTAAASTLEVKADKDRMNTLVEDAKSAAGNKIAANKGTAVHAYTEDRDRILVGMETDPREIPEEFIPTVDAYEATLKAFGLEPVPGLIEFTTAVLQYEVAGTSDRVYRVTRDMTFKLNGRPVTLYAGEYVIGDVKGLALTERIPTPTGWTTMGEVQVGDIVFDAYGQPTRVAVKSRAKRIGTYIVRFDDGSSVTCDSEHIWWTSTGTRPGEPTAKSIREIIATLQDPRTGQKHHRVPVAGPLELPEADLPIDPYLLGCWLGDGHRRGDSITKGLDLFEILQADGHVLGVEQKQKGDCVSRSVKGLRSALRAEGLQFNKHIPAAYLRASVSQRTALLRGLMDTDGTWNRARRSAEFSTVDKALALQMEELLLSLGQRPQVSETTARGYGCVTQVYKVCFTPVDLQPFRLPRKAEQAAASVKPVTSSTRRVIVSVEPGPDVETACIGVDAPTHTYLAGDRMVPTHNTGADLGYGWQEIAIQLALYAQGLNTVGVWDWGTRGWAYPSFLDGGGQEVRIQVRTDVGIIPHLPVDRSTTKAPLATLYAVDLDAGWAATVLCGQVRGWRKERTLATPLEIADVADSGPQTLVSRPVPESRPVTLEDRAKAVTSKAEASAVFQEAVGAKVPRERLDRLISTMSDKLKSITEPGG